MFREHIGSGYEVCSWLPHSGGQLECPVLMTRSYFKTTFFWNCGDVLVLLECPIPDSCGCSSLRGVYFPVAFPLLPISKLYLLTRRNIQTLSWTILDTVLLGCSPPAWTSHTGRGDHQVRGQGLAHLFHLTALSTPGD